MGVLGLTRAAGVDEVKRAEEGAEVGSAWGCGGLGGVFWFDVVFHWRVLACCDVVDLVE